MHAEKVIMIISHFYPLLGGAEVQAQRLASALRADGVDIFVLTRRFKCLPAYEVIDGVPVYRSIRTVDVPILFGLLYVASVASFLYRRRNDYTIIHCNILQEYQTIVSIIMKYIFKKKVIAKMSSSGMTSDIKIMKQSVTGRITLRLLKKADRIVSLCSAATEELMHAGISAERVQQIHNGIDTRSFPVKTGINHKQHKLITFIGRLDAYKGVEYLLEAFRLVLAEGADVKLQLIGKGPDELKLKRLTAALQLQETVIFRGRQEHVAEELSQTDIFVLPSLSEGMSNVLLEAMSCGLPVVATGVGGAKDMIRHGINGMLVPPGDSTALCNALVEVLGNEQLALSLGREARKTVEDRYLLVNTAERYQQLYKELSAGTVPLT